MAGFTLAFAACEAAIRHSRFIHRNGAIMNDRRWRLRVLYSGTLLLTYFGFFLMCSFLPELMVKPVFASSPVSIAMWLGAAIIAGSVAMTGLYMVSADRL